MKRSLRTWILGMLCLLCPALAQAERPSVTRGSAAIGLQARCPLADGTWQIEQVLKPTFSVEHGIALETHDMPVRIPLAAAAGSATNASDKSERSARSLRSVSKINPDYLPHVAPHDRCVRFQVSSGINLTHVSHWEQSRPVAAQSLTQNQPLITADVATCMLGSAIDGIVEFAWDDYSHAFAARAQAINNQLFAAIPSTIESIASLNHGSDLDRAIVQVEPAIGTHLPSVCTPPPDYLLRPWNDAFSDHVVSDSIDVFAVADESTDESPEHALVVEATLEAAANRLESVASWLRDVAQQISPSARVASHAKAASATR